MRLCNWLEKLLPATKSDIRNLRMKVSELEARLDDETARVTKIAAEVQVLKDSLSDVDLPQAAVDSLDRLSAALKSVDDLNPDSTPTEPPA